MKYSLSIFLFLFYFSCTYSEPIVDTPSENEDSTLRIIAHRGASHDAPENTKAAFQLGMDRKADGVEFDIHLTKDEEMIIMHDKTAFRTTNIDEVFPGNDNALIQRLVLSEIQKLDAGSWFSLSFKNEPVPTLLETLQLLKHNALAVMELKGEGVGTAAAEQIINLQMQNEVVAISFNTTNLIDYHTRFPEGETGYLTDKKISDDSVQRALAHIENAKKTYSKYIVCHYSLVDRAYVDTIHEQDFFLWVYTVNMDDDARRLKDVGVDGIITNRPLRIRDALYEGYP